MRRVTMLAVLGATMLMALGCSGGTGQGEVATLATPSGAVPNTEQGLGAAAMVDCLRRSDVPAVLEQWDDGQAAVVFDSPNALWEMCRRDDGMCSGGGGENLSDPSTVKSQETLDLVARPYMAEWAALPPERVGVDILIIGDADYTPVYEVCLAESDYQVPIVPINPAEEIAQEQAVATRSNEWAACARENGLADLNDADPPKADDWRTTPTIALPVDISDTLLRAVIEACPPFDLGARERKEPAVDPNLGFDVPGWDGRGKLLSGAVDRETSVRISELVDIIYEPLERFFEESAPSE